MHQWFKNKCLLIHIAIVNIQIDCCHIIILFTIPYNIEITFVYCNIINLMTVHEQPEILQQQVEDETIIKKKKTVKKVIKKGILDVNTLHFYLIFFNKSVITNKIIVMLSSNLPNIVFSNTKN